MKYVHLYVILSLFCAQVIFAAVDQDVRQHEHQNSWISTCSSTVTKGSKISTELTLMLYSIIHQDLDIPQKAACLAAGLVLANSDSLENINPKNYIGEIPTAIFSILTSFALATYTICSISHNNQKNLNMYECIGAGLGLTTGCIAVTGLIRFTDSIPTKEKVIPTTI